MHALRRACCPSSTPSARCAIAVAQHRARRARRHRAGRLPAALVRPAASTRPATRTPSSPATSTSPRPTTTCWWSRGHFALSIDAPVQQSRPSIDVLFESAADAYGEEVVAVILTGANSDGAARHPAVKRGGGLTLAQDPETAERREMPEAAIATGAVDRVATLEDIGCSSTACRRDDDGGPDDGRAARPSCWSTTGPRTCWPSRRARPLGHDMVRAASGEEALRQLLRARVRGDPPRRADARAWTASRPPRRSRSASARSDIPIIFLTAMSREPEHRMRGSTPGPSTTSSSRSSPSCCGPR